MSQQRQRIRAAVESRGFTVKSLTWEPIYSGGEMEGVCGGWTLIIDPHWNDHIHAGDDLYALNVDELLAEIDWTLPQKTPCNCAGEPDEQPTRHPLVPIFGDPERPLHRPDCEWHISYRLRWWRDTRQEQAPVLVSTDPDDDHSRAYETAVAAREEQRND